MKKFLVACGRGARVSWQFGVLPIQIVLAIFSAVALITAPWTLAGIDNYFWEVFLQALALCVLLITLLSIGLMPYFGQREITKDCERHSKMRQGWFNKCEREKEKLQQELAEYKRRFSELK